MEIRNIVLGIIILLFLCAIGYPDIYIENIKYDGNTAVGGNLFELADIHLHTDYTKAVANAGTWYNISFTHNGDTLKHNFNHTHNDTTNDTITVIIDGVYDIKFAGCFNDTSAVPDDNVYMRIIVNGVENNGSGTNAYMSKQYAHVIISGCSRISLNAGDEVKLQFTSSSTNTNLGVQTGYLDHVDSARLCIVRIR